jgi:capsular polysaccharide transport system permease protein
LGLEMADVSGNKPGAPTGLQVQLRVIGALLMREILTRYGRHNIGFMWLFVEPMIFTLGVTALWTFSRMHMVSSIPIVAFALTGYSSVLLWRNMPGRCVQAIEPNLSLLYHRQVKIFDVFVSRVILEAAGATISFLVLGFVFASTGWMKGPQDMLKVLLGWLLLAWFGMALGLYLGALSGRNELVEKLWGPASYLLFPLSGAAFMVDWLPPEAQRLVLALPMVHGVEMVRDGYFGTAVTTHYNVLFMMSCCLVLTLLALAEIRIVARRLVPQ